MILVLNFWLHSVKLLPPAFSSMFRNGVEEGVYVELLTLRTESIWIGFEDCCWLPLRIMSLLSFLHPRKKLSKYLSNLTWFMPSQVKFTLSSPICLGLVLLMHQGHLMSRKELLELFHTPKHMLLLKWFMGNIREGPVPCTIIPPLILIRALLIQVPTHHMHIPVCINRC